MLIPTWAHDDFSVVISWVIHVVPAGVLEVEVQLRTRRGCRPRTGSRRFPGPCRSMVPLGTTVQPWPVSSALALVTL